MTTIEVDAAMVIELLFSFKHRLNPSFFMVNVCNRYPTAKHFVYFSAFLHHDQDRNLATTEAQSDSIIHSIIIRGYKALFCDLTQNQALS